MAEIPSNPPAVNAVQAPVGFVRAQSPTRARPEVKIALAALRSPSPEPQGNHWFTPIRNDFSPRRQEVVDRILHPYGGEEGAIQKLGEEKGKGLVRGVRQLARNIETLKGIWQEHRLEAQKSGFVYAEAGQNGLDSKIAKEMTKSLTAAGVKQGLIIDDGGDAYIRLGAVLSTKGGVNMIEYAVKLDNLELAALRIERVNLNEDPTNPLEARIEKEFRGNEHIVQTYTKGQMVQEGVMRNAGIQKLYHGGDARSLDAFYFDQKLMRGAFERLQPRDQGNMRIALANKEEAVRLLKEAGLVSPGQFKVTGKLIAETAGGQKDLSHNPFAAFLLQPHNALLREEIIDGTDLAQVVRLIDEAVNNDSVEGHLVRPESGFTAQEVAKQTALGIKTLHDRGILWADVKSDNFLVNGGVISAADFGGAVDLYGTGDLAQGKRVTDSGTIDYIPPEHLVQKHELKPEARQLLQENPVRFYQGWDVYAWGAMNCKMESGRPLPWFDLGNSALTASEQEQLERCYSGGGRMMLSAIAQKIDTDSYARLFPEPEDHLSKEHLVWEAMHPNPQLRPTIQEIEARLRLLDPLPSEEPANKDGFEHLAWQVQHGDKPALAAVKQHVNRILYEEQQGEMDKLAEGLENKLDKIATLQGKVMSGNASTPRKIEQMKALQVNLQQSVPMDKLEYQSKQMSQLAKAAGMPTPSLERAVQQLRQVAALTDRLMVELQEVNESEFKEFTDRISSRKGFKGVDEQQMIAMLGNAASQVELLDAKDLPAFRSMVQRSVKPKSEEGRAALQQLLQAINMIIPQSSERAGG